MSKTYKTFQGKEIDMTALATKFETMPAVGNIRVNARGDELGPDGKIIRTKEELLSEYYDNNPRTVSDEELSLAKVKIKSTKKAKPEPQKVEPQKVEAKKETKDIE